MSPTENIPGLAQQPPLIERLSRYLISPHPNASSEEVRDLLYVWVPPVVDICLVLLCNPDVEDETDDS